MYVFVLVSFEGDGNNFIFSIVSSYKTLKHQFSFLPLRSSNSSTKRDQQKSLECNLIAFRNFLLDDIDNTWLCDCTKVTKLITFAGHDLAHNPTHDLCIK